MRFRSSGQYHFKKLMRIVSATDRARPLRAAHHVVPTKLLPIPSRGKVCSHCRNAVSVFADQGKRVFRTSRGRFFDAPVRRDGLKGGRKRLKSRLAVRSRQAIIHLFLDGRPRPSVAAVGGRAAHALSMNRSMVVIICIGPAHEISSYAVSPSRRAITVVI